MLQPWVLIFFSLIYIGILFAIAHYGDKPSQAQSPSGFRASIYSLSLAVYCTSWTYYGAVGNASVKGWEFLAIYLGPILLFVFGHSFLRRVARICIDQNITTIADFIASRYGKSQLLAVLVTLIAIMGTLPYIALQLKAVASSYEVITAFAKPTVAFEFSAPFLNDTGLIVAIIMAIFSIFFGTRYVNASESHHGIILAIAFESVVKLLALIGVCLFAVYFVFNGPEDLVTQAGSNSAAINLLSPQLDRDFFQITFLGNTLLALAAIFCLPRQFHVAFVEVDQVDNMKKSRWLFPVYLIITSLVVVPISLSGLTLFADQQINPDMFVLMIPMAAGNDLLTLLVFLGGFSAATGMVIVAVITLSTMICNDIVMPILFKVSKSGLRQRHDMTQILLLIRRLAIVVILLLSYFYHQYISTTTALASIGLIAFVAAIQFAPAIIAGVYWKRANQQAATIGLIVGFAVWVYTLFLPSLNDTGWLPNNFIEKGLFNQSFLKPYALFGLDHWQPITHALILSLLANISCFVYFSVTRKSDLTERIQTAKFIQTAQPEKLKSGLPWWSTVAIGELKVLAEKYIGEQATATAFDHYAKRNATELIPSEKADTELVQFTERLLAGAIGAASARAIINSVLKKKDLPIEDVFNIVDEASQAVQFNQELLNTTIEHIDQGISVVDQQLNLIAWNTRYLQIHRYPPELIQVGRPIIDILKHSAATGGRVHGQSGLDIEQRLQYMRAGKPHTYFRYRRDGTVLQIQGKPMPGVGYVTSFTDVTELKKAEQELRTANEDLEKIVAGRTEQLSRVNRELEQAIQSKNQFLTAVNHDVMQPLNAARLFTSALSQQHHEAAPLSEKIHNSIHSAEEIIQTLLDIAKLDSGGIDQKVTTFPINDIMERLVNEFSLIAQKRELELTFIPSSIVIENDAHLVRRVLQNFVSNALRYTAAGGRIIIGCRRSRDQHNQPMVCVQVHDTGVGIKPSEQAFIFDEFKRLDNPIYTGSRGIGLGLSIAKRIANLIGAKIKVKSKPDVGSVFSLTLPMTTQTYTQTNRADIKPALKESNLTDIKVLCVDNDENVLDAMRTLLKNWQCDNHCVIDLATALTRLKQGFKPNILLIDYHLNDENGLDVIATLREKIEAPVPAVLISADLTDALMNQAAALGIKHLHKPLNPAALRNLIVRLTKR